MASAQEPGKLRFYRQVPNGTRIFIFGGNVAALGPSGSADGVIGSTPEKWSYVPMQNAPQKILRQGDRLVVTFTSEAADTLDASDTQWSLPITLLDGSTDTLGSPDSAVDWDVKQASDVLFNAGIEQDVCIRSVDQPFMLGSNTTKAFLTMEDDTA